VVDVLDQAKAKRGAPECIRMDNGPELIANAIRDTWVRFPSPAPTFARSATIPDVMNMPAAATRSVRTDSQAIASLVLGVVSLPALVFPPCGALGVAAVVVGVIARHRIKNSAGQLKGYRLAIGGIALGVLGVLMGLALPAFFIGVLIWSLFHGGQLPGGG
jgi:hypothetical protein